MFALPVAVTLIIYATLEIEFPRRGLIRLRDTDKTLDRSPQLHELAEASNTDRVRGERLRAAMQLSVQDLSNPAENRYFPLLLCTFPGISHPRHCRYSHRGVTQEHH